MKPGRVVMLVAGCLIALAALGLLVGAAALGLVIADERDADGYFTAPTVVLETPTAAITSGRIDLGTEPGDDWWADQELATVRFRVARIGEGSVFVGIGRDVDVERYLDGVPHDELVDVEVDPFVPTYRREHDEGSATPVPPGEADIWVAEASGPGEVELTWSLRPGRWSVVVMDADGRPGVSVDVEVGARLQYLWVVVVAAVLGGLWVAGVALALIIGGALGASSRPTPPAVPAPPPAA